MEELIEKMGFETNRRLVRDFKNQPVTETFPQGPIKFKSLLEARWARYMEDVLKPAGEILWWGYEVLEIDFENVTSGPPQYTPDFIAVTTSLEVVIYECKGWLEGSDVTKFKRTMEGWPHAKIVLVMAKKDYHKGRINRYAAARKYLAAEILYAEPLFKKFNIRLQSELVPQEEVAP